MTEHKTWLKYPLFLSAFNEPFIFFDRLWKKNSWYFIFKRKKIQIPEIKRL